MRLNMEPLQMEAGGMSFARQSVKWAKAAGARQQLWISKEKLAASKETHRPWK